MNYIFWEIKKITDGFSKSRLDYDWVSTNEQVIKVSKFLKNIGMLKLNSEQFILPQECIDFLIVQAVRKDSIVNQESEKYLPVLETAIIDFTRLDYIDKKIKSGCEDFFITYPATFIQYANESND